MENLIQKAEQYVFELFKDKLNLNFTYHNFIHSQFVVSKVKELIKAGNIGEEDATNLIVACWFHDSGYVEQVENHEQIGAEIAEKFLKENKVPQERIDKIKGLILATTLSRPPQNQLEKIIKDADTSNLGDEVFERLTQQVRREVELRTGKNFTNREWDEQNYEFMTREHKFYTDHAKKNWQPIKQAHLLNIQKRLGRKKSKAAKAFGKPGRGIETMFRVTLNNHTRLSDIADSKANILLSVNAIIISIALSTLLPKLSIEGNGYLVLPTLTMLFFSVISIIFAIMATRPNVSREVFTMEDVEHRKVNLLFFGNFTKISLEDYQDAMVDMMSDNEFLYSSMTRDLYYLGKVLHRKYLLLRLTYAVFLIGIILSVITFVLAFIQNTDVNVLLN